MAPGTASRGSGNGGSFIGPSSILNPASESGRTVGAASSKIPTAFSDDPFSGQDSPTASSVSGGVAQITGGTGTEPTLTSGTVAADSGYTSGAHSSPIEVPIGTVGSGSPTETFHEPRSSGDMTLPASSASGGLTYGMLPSATGLDPVPVQTGSDSASFPEQSGTGTVGYGDSNPTDGGAVIPPASTGLSAQTGAPMNQTIGGSNATLQVSPMALDALSFALFLKNLGASIFNSSKLDTQMTREYPAPASFATLIGNISVVSYLYLLDRTWTVANSNDHYSKSRHNKTL